MPPKYTPEQRISAFWSRVDKSDEPDGCWVWTGAFDEHGYGALSILNRHVVAHRYSYATFVADIPHGLYVLHRCDNPACVRPDHLFVGTHQDNMRDMVAKGRHVFQAHPEKRPYGDRSGSHTHPEHQVRGERVYGAKLTAEQVLEIRRLYDAGAGTCKEIGQQFGICASSVSYIGRRAHWQHVPEE